MVELLNSISYVSILELTRYLTFFISLQESPIQRLLFHKDIERYRKSIGSFYSQMEPVADHDFWRTLDQLSDVC